MDENKPSDMCFLLLVSCHTNIQKEQEKKYICEIETYVIFNKEGFQGLTASDVREILIE
jgi:hypothetical protein